MNARKSAEKFLRRWLMKEFVSSNCSNPSSPVSFGPQLGVVTFGNPNGGFAAGDLYSGKLTFPARFIQFVGYGNRAGGLLSVGSQPGPTCFVHFTPLNLPQSTAVAVQYRGNEPWFQFGVAAGSANQVVTQTWMKFRPGAEIQEFYIDVDNPGGYAKAFYTFIYTNDVDSMLEPPQIA